MTISRASSRPAARIGVTRRDDPGGSRKAAGWRLVLALLLAVFALAAQDAAWNREHYTKYEFQIPARDGVKLFTAVYVPKDTSKTYPILFSRTPYSCAPYGVDNYREVLGPAPGIYAKEGFIFA